MCLNINMKVRDTLTYLSMIPMVFGILGMIAVMALAGTTFVAGVVIGVGEWLAQN